MKIYPTREYLLECFDYKKETGELFCKKRPYSHFDNKHGAKVSNGRNKGRQAGHKSRGFISLWLDEKYYQRSTIIWILETGNANKAPLHHLNKDTEDDRFCNLSLSPSNAKGFRSIARRGKFEARVRYNGQWSGIGSFDSEEKASEAYKKAIKDIQNGEFVHRIKIPISGRFGVVAKGDKFIAKVKFNNTNQHLGMFDTLIEASNAYQKAKKQIKDNSFVATSKPMQNKHGLSGVKIKNKKFIASIQINGERKLM